MLSILLVIPLVGCAIVAFTSSQEKMKQSALGASLINFVISIVLWSNFNSDIPEGTYQFTQEFLPEQVTFCHLHIGVDGISLYFVLLTTLIMPICILSNWSNIGSAESETNSDQKLYLLPFLLYLRRGTYTCSCCLSSVPVHTIRIAIKTPLVPFNTWLTYAHSEAPVGGSIVLAGVILKLATYGFLRIMLQFFPDASSHFSPIVQGLAAISVIYASLSTLRQTDFKKLVAYSSVSHVAVVVIGLFSNTVQGIEGAIILSLAHGLVSPALFFLVGGVLYDRYHTRTIRYYRGLVVYMPIFAVFFFLFTIFNTAVPLSIFQRSALIGCLGATGIVLSAAYRYIQDINRREFIILIPLLLLTVLVGVYPNFILEDIHNNVSSLIYNNSLLSRPP
ncbi:UNVERIFIED_CONTAM: NADH-ubiquinone oxidoreductase chain 4 [Trichonephila clavipes]